MKRETKSQEAGDNSCVIYRKWYAMEDDDNRVAFFWKFISTDMSYKLTELALALLVHRGLSITKPHRNEQLDVFSSIQSIFYCTHIMKRLSSTFSKASLDQERYISHQTSPTEDSNAF